MKYEIVYDIESGEVISINEVRSAISYSEDESTCISIMNGECRGRVVGGKLVRNDEPVRIEENIVPSKEVALALGLEENVGVPKDTLISLAESANLEL